MLRVCKYPKQNYKEYRVQAEIMRVDIYRGYTKYDASKQTLSVEVVAVCMNANVAGSHVMFIACHCTIFTYTTLLHHLGPFSHC